MNLEVYLTQKTGTREITKLLSSWTWSGDKGSIVRKLAASILYQENSGLPVPEIGNPVVMAEGSQALFSGYVVQRRQSSEEHTLSFTCYDKGLYLNNNDGTYKFRDASAEEIARTVCRDRDIPVCALAPTNTWLSRKFSGVRLSKIISTAYSLASEQTGVRYAIRMTPEGLLVKVKEQSGSSLKLKPKSNLIRAATTESIVNMVNQVSIYDQQGVLIDQLSRQDAVNLYGVMERHLPGRGDGSAGEQAAALLEDGGLEQTVAVDVLGDSSLVTGETVVVDEENTGLRGVFWIDADAHTWKRGLYQCALTLNCRSVMTKTTAGSELK